MAYNVYNAMDIGDASVSISRKGIVNYKQAVFADMNGVKRELDDYKNIVCTTGKQVVPGDTVMTLEK